MGMPTFDEKAFAHWQERNRRIDEEKARLKALGVDDVNAEFQACNLVDREAAAKGEGA